MGASALRLIGKKTECCAAECLLIDSSIIWALLIVKRVDQLCESEANRESMAA